MVFLFWTLGVHGKHGGFGLKVQHCIGPETGPKKDKSLNQFKEKGTCCPAKKSVSSPVLRFNRKLWNWVAVIDSNFDNTPEDPYEAHYQILTFGDDFHFKFKISAMPEQSQW